MTGDQYIAASIAVSIAVGIGGFALGRWAGLREAALVARGIAVNLNDGRQKSQAEVNTYECACWIAEEIEALR